MHSSRCNGRIDPLKKPLGRRRRICEKNTHICLQIQVLLFALVFLLVIVQGRTMGKLVSIVTTCLVVLSSRFYFWKNWLRRRIPRRTVIGTTDRRGDLVPKHIENLNLGTENRLSELRNGVAGQTVTGVTNSHRPFREIESLKSMTEQQDGPSQARRAVTDCIILVWVEFFYTF